VVADHGDGQWDGQHDGETGRREGWMGVVVVDDDDDGGVVVVD
jgi:hypothetical protein